jgi:hypothetical protein
VLFEGSRAVIDRATRDLRSILGKCGIAETQLVDGDAATSLFQAVLDAYIEPVEDRSITFRSTGLPTTVDARALAATDVVRAGGARCDTITDLRTGDVIVRVTGTSAEHTADLIVQIDAELRLILPGRTVLAGDQRLRATLDAWGQMPPTLETLRAVKARFDPSAILAPGRDVGGI